MSRLSFQVREATPADLDTIIEFNARLAHETEGKTLPRRTLTRGVSAALNDRNLLSYWVVEATDPANSEPAFVVGQAAVTREWSDWRAGWIWWFQSVYVHPNYRSQGAFRLVYSHVRTLAKATKDVIGLRLYVEVANEQAQRVYQALGMKPGGYDVYEDLWIEAH